MKPAHQAFLSITNCWNLLKLMSIELVMPSNHLILCCPLLLLPSIFPSIRVFSKESVICFKWPMYWSFSFSISPSKELHFVFYTSCAYTQGHLLLQQKEGIQLYYYYNNQKDRVTQYLDVGQLLYPLSSWLTQTANEKSSQLTGIRIRTCLNNMDSLSPRLILYCN